MNDPRWIEENINEAKSRLSKRGGHFGLEEMLDLVAKRKEKLLATEELKAKRNKINNDLKSADKNLIEHHRLQMRELSGEIKELDKELLSLEENLKELSLSIPNIPREDVPQGLSEEDNVVIKEVLKRPQFVDFSPKDHVDLGKLTDTIDFVRAAKISGARFAFLKGMGARLNRALLQFFTNYHVDKGDTELTTPYMVKAQAMVGVGQFPKFVEDVFTITKEGEEPYYLIPTAEVPVTNYFAGEILEQDSLPMRFCAYSPCFRSEAGSAGKDTRGLIRMHQFEKVEMVRFAKPEQAMDELNKMVERASDMLTQLELPHRIVELCGGDLGFTSEKTFDLEVYLPAQDAYREVSSCSSFGSFQARRAMIRMRGEKKPVPLVTLNGSGLPLGRTLVAIYENHQQKDGSILIPKVLQPYMGGVDRILPCDK